VCASSPLSLFASKDRQIYHTITVNRSVEYTREMHKIFECDEKSWISKVSTDLALWRQNGGSTPEFLSTAVSSWFKAFLYRHPRLARHYPYTAQQCELTLYGQAYYTLAKVGQHISLS
jgi:hypothetical protein